MLDEASDADMGLRLSLPSRSDLLAQRATSTAADLTRPAGRSQVTLAVFSLLGLGSATMPTSRGPLPSQDLMHP
ncbi:hypothetical protein J1614_006950 [Plenodomus biglobosus]|nr:hypothetical protein J1614_006950 [Plenodomus biglobosus]